MSCKLRGSVMCWLMVGITQATAGQVIWDGEAGDGEWSNPLNWVGNVLPAASDKVVLDNSLLQFSYEVRITTGESSVSVMQVKIAPATGNSIRLTIPPENTFAPALICNGGGYGLELGPRAIFQNSSGAPSGAPLETADSIWINNGAKFIHNTPRSHAANVRALSRSPGTETGEFEFRIPVASSTISISGQVFGRLKLSPGPGGTINYTGTGTNDLIIRGDLEMAPGVNLNFNLEGQVLVTGNFVQNGGTCNLGTTARLLVMNIGGDLIQAASAIITETGTARPRLQLIGPTVQTIKIDGKLENEVILEVNNLAGLVLESELRISHMLVLTRGQIQTGIHAVVLTGSASLETPGQLQESFIEGKIKKEGLISGAFVFPVGKNGVVRWVGLKNATGNFLVEFIRSDPRIIDPDLGAGLAHISGLEHWRIEAGADGAAGNVELSFDDVNSGGVTALDQLRVAYLNDGSWQDAGNIATTGSAGGRGSVTSTLINIPPGSAARYFTLASSQALQNPLPVSWNWFRAEGKGNEVLLEWSIQDSDTDIYMIERSVDGRHFQNIGQVTAIPGRQLFEFRDPLPQSGLSYYRVAGLNINGEKTYSRVVSVRYGEWQKPTMSCFIQARKARILLPSPGAGTYFVTMYHTDGKMVHSVLAKATENVIDIQIPVNLNAGKMIIVRVIDPGGKQFVTRALAK